MMLKARIPFMLLTALLAAAAGAVEVRAQQVPACPAYGETCRTVDDYSAVDYWYWHAYLGVADVVDCGPLCYGRLQMNTKMCFRVDKTTLDDAYSHTLGYHQAFADWLKWLHGDRESWPRGEEMARVKAGMEAIAGRKFASQKSASEWWSAERDFLRWSASEDRLVVDPLAKKNQAPVLNKGIKISALEYWSYWGQGALRNVHRSGDRVRAIAWMPPEGDEDVWVYSQVLEDRQQKADGLRHAVSVLILDGVALKGISVADLSVKMDQLKLITGDTWDTRQQWMRWFERNRDRLALSADGSRLIVTQQEKP